MGTVKTQSYFSQSFLPLKGFHLSSPLYSFWEYSSQQSRFKIKSQSQMFLFLLKYSWHITLSKFEVCDALVWCICILQDESYIALTDTFWHSNFSYRRKEHPIKFKRYKMVSCKNVLYPWFSQSAQVFAKTTLLLGTCVFLDILTVSKQIHIHVI